MAADWYLYMLECEGGSIYTGIARDVQTRFADHVAGKGAKYTRSHKPIQILRTEEFDNRSEASKREYRVKRMTASQKRALCQVKR